MRTRIQKWGNSLALRIPKAFAQEAGFARDVPIEMSLEEGKLVVATVIESPITLERLLEQITEDNIHHEVDMGLAIGEEIW